MEYSEGEPGSLPAPILYAVLRLRVDVFVVEQECAYPELDGRDLEPGCRWWWAEEGGRILATLRLLDEDEETGRIGRVATAVDGRGRGLAGALMDRAVAECGARGHRRIVLDAQTVMADWYARRGFVVTGEEFFDDGIGHVPMERLLDS
ncbi:GNAT family N-acetyltransferase [Propionibacteriaceae bacterium Y1685]